MNLHKILYHLAFGCGLVICLGGCQKDNFAPPETKFTGHIVYQGKPIAVKNNGSGTVYFELWQSGFGKSGAIDVYLNQDGSFSALLFNGEYKLIIPPSQGPFISIANASTGSDTIDVKLSGNQSMDIEVLPYYIINKAAFTLGADSVVKVDASITKIIKDERARDIESVSLYVNRTSFVDDDNHIAFTDLNGADIADLSHINLSAKIPKDISGVNIGVADQKYFYARVGVKVAGVEDRLFSDIVKVEL